MLSKRGRFVKQLYVLSEICLELNLLLTQVQANPYRLTDAAILGIGVKINWLFDHSIARA